jgi:hypothetical protein
MVRGIDFISAASRRGGEQHQEGSELRACSARAEHVQAELAIGQGVQHGQLARWQRIACAFERCVRAVVTVAQHLEAGCGREDVEQRAAGLDREVERGALRCRTADACRGDREGPAPQPADLWQDLAPAHLDFELALRRHGEDARAQAAAPEVLEEARILASADDLLVDALRAACVEHFAL